MTISLLFSKYNIVLSTCVLSTCVLSTCVITTVFSYYFITPFLFTKKTNKKDDTTPLTSNNYFSYDSGDSLIFLSPDTNSIKNIPKQEYNYHIDDENYVFVTAITNFSKESAVILASKSAV